MTFKSAGEGSSPSWYQAGLDHIWLPYTQMKTAPPPLPVVRTDGSRIVLADGRELIDGIASWWTACHGYNHPHIRAAVERQLQTHAACDVRRPGARAGVHAGAAAGRAAAGRSRPGVLLRVGLGRGRGRHEDGGAVLAQSRRPAAGRKFVAFRGGYHGDTTGAMSVSDPDDGMHALFHGLLPEQHIVDAAARRRARGGVRAHARTPRRRDRRHHRRAAGAGRRRHAVPRAGGAAAAARARRPLRPAADLRRDLHRLRPHRQPCSPARPPASRPTSSRCRRR